MLHYAFCLAAFAAPFCEDDPPHKALDEKKREIPSAAVVIKGKRNEAEEKAITTTVSIKTEKDIEQKLIFGIIDLTRLEPGIDVSSRPDRQGATSFGIRGIGGNRVLILVDGVNLPDGPEAGRNFSRDFVDLDSVKRVEILRGPSSALHGSDAIGGVVTYATKDPGDYLADGSKFFSAVKAAYASAYNGSSSTATAVGASGNWGGMLLGTVKSGHEAKPAMGNPNTMFFRTSNVLGKAEYSSNPVHACKLSFQSFERKTESNLFSETGPISMPPGAVTDYFGNDASRRNQFGIDYFFDDDGAFFQYAEGRAFYQNASSLERSEEYRAVFTDYSSRLRHTDYRFQQKVLGLRAHAEKRFTSTNGWRHNILLGLDLAQTETSRPYDRTEINLATGDASKTVGGQQYPSKVMPDSTTAAAGAFVQSEVFAPTGSWAFITGLRANHYSLNPKVDGDFDNSNVMGAQISSVSNLALSPKIGLIYTIDPTWSLYGQYANGFRNPPYDNVNMAMFVPMAGIMIVPNPNIEPEKSNSFELGLNSGNSRNWSLSAAAFYNRYSGFITDVLVSPDSVDLPPDAAMPSMIFQFQNLQAVRIYGTEFKGGFTFLNSFCANMALAYAKGDDLTNGEPLDTIAPINGVLSLGYKGGDKWGIDMYLSLSAKKTRVPLYEFQNPETDAPFQAPGFGLIDLIGHFSITAKGSWRIQAGIFNAFDKTYWRWEDVRGFAAGNENVLRYSQPGRNASVSIVYSWS